jgi:hypothetical protein
MLNKISRGETLALFLIVALIAAMIVSVRP